MLTNRRDIPAQSKVGYLPVIDALPTEFSTVKEILKHSEEIGDKLNLKYICLVFDEAIYAKVQQIRWKKERYISRFVVRLGEFHMAMSFCGPILKLFKDAGLQVLLVLFQHIGGIIIYLLVKRLKMWIFSAKTFKTCLFYC